MKKDESLIPNERIERSILLIRGHKVMLDKDLAVLYGVSTSQLNKAVTRNSDRFPAHDFYRKLTVVRAAPISSSMKLISIGTDDFMFQLTQEEHRNLMFHFGISSWGGVRKRPRVFTEQGVAMLSGVLRSKRAIQMNVRIIRIFVKLRELLSTNKELAVKFSELEKRLGEHDVAIRDIVAAIRKMMAQGVTENVLKKPKGPIGFQP